MTTPRCMLTMWRRPRTIARRGSTEGYEVEAVRQRLARRVGLLRARRRTAPGALRGYIDRVRASSIAGWAQNADAPEAPVCLDIFADGKFIGRLLANIYRDDLQAAGLGSGRHGFEFIPPAGVSSSRSTPWKCAVRSTAHLSNVREIAPGSSVLLVTGRWFARDEQAFLINFVRRAGTAVFDTARSSTPDSTID